MSDQTLEAVQSIRERLGMTIRRITLAETAYGLCLVLGTLLLVWVILAGIESVLWMGQVPRTILFYSVVGGTCALAAYYVVGPLLRYLGVLDGPSETSVARTIGHHYPEVADRLLNLLDLADNRRSDAPPALVDRAIQSLADDVHPVHFERVEDFQRPQKAAYAALLPFLLLGTFLLAAPDAFITASQRLATPHEHFAPPAPFKLNVAPGAAEIVKGDSLHITIRANGTQRPQRTTLTLNNRGEEHVEEIELTADEDGHFRHSLVNVRRPMRYRVDADPVRTRWFPVTLTDRPVLRTLEVTLDYPDYTGIPSRRLDPNVGDVKALPGTEVHVQARTGTTSVAAGYLRFDNGEETRLTLDEEDASARFTLNREGSYQVVLENEDGVTNRSPISYSLQLTSDAVPSVTLVEPGATAELTESARSTLRMRMSDDYGFRALRLYYRLAESGQREAQDGFETISLPLDRPRQLDQDITYEWLLRQSTSLDPAPGDIIEYYVRVWDNDAVAGYKSARTATRTLQFPTLVEQYEQFEEQQDAAESEAQDVLNEAESVHEQFEQLQDELRRKNESDWEDQRQLERIRQRQEDVESRVNNLTRQLESMTDEMEQQSLVDEETLNLYKELQRVMDEVTSPELQEAMQQLQEALQQLDRKQMQQALQDVEFNEQQYQQRLKRAVEMFEKAKVQQKLSESARRLEDLARREEELARETEERMKQEPGRHNPSPDAEEQNTSSQQEAQQDSSSAGDQTSQLDSGEQKQPDEETSPSADPSSDSPNEDLARKQEEARSAMQELEQELEELGQEMNEMRSAPKRQMQEFQEQMQQMQLPEEMKKNSDQLRENQLQEAQEGQQQMQKQLQKMQQSMQQMQQNMQGQQMEMNMAGLRQALSDVIQLSHQQEGLRSAVRGLSTEDPQLRDFAQRQRKLTEGLRAVADSLQRLARDIPQMRRDVQQETGKAQTEMRTAVDQLAERNPDQAAGHQKSSMMHLNELGLMLSDLLDQMQSGAGGSGSMSQEQLQQQLQQTAQQQQQLNDQLQKMLNEIQGDRLSLDQQERLEQMARQQQSIQRSLEELSRNREVKGNVLGDLKKIAEDMEESIGELRRNRIEPRTMERQQRILSRLLDAQQSMREREKSRQREGRSGEDMQRESPDGATPPEEAEQLRRALIRALENGYSSDYEELIKRYFELLQDSGD